APGGEPSIRGKTPYRTLQALPEPPTATKPRSLRLVIPFEAAFVGQQHPHERRLHSHRYSHAASRSSPVANGFQFRHGPSWHRKACACQPKPDCFLLKMQIGLLDYQTKPELQWSEPFAKQPTRARALSGNQLAVAKLSNPLVASLFGSYGQL